MERDIPIIDDPLAWQDRMDAIPAPINTYGSARFWKTVSARGLLVVCRDGAPDFSEIVFSLGGGIGLELSTTNESQFIKYRFVEVADEETGEDEAEPPDEEEKEFDDAITAELSAKLGFDVSDPEQLKRFWRQMIRK